MDGVTSHHPQRLAAGYLYGLDGQHDDSRWRRLASNASGRVADLRSRGRRRAKRGKKEAFPDPGHVSGGERAMGGQRAAGRGQKGRSRSRRAWRGNGGFDRGRGGRRRIVKAAAAGAGAGEAHAQRNTVKSEGGRMPSCGWRSAAGWRRLQLHARAPSIRRCFSRRKGRPLLSFVVVVCSVALRWPFPGNSVARRPQDLNLINPPAAVTVSLLRWSRGFRASLAVARGSLPVPQARQGDLATLSIVS